MKNAFPVGNSTMSKKERQAMAYWSKKAMVGADNETELRLWLSFSRCRKFNLSQAFNTSLCKEQ
jgi:hypothetical protein